MLVLETVNRHLSGLFDLFYIPKEISSQSGQFVVQVSDTPRTFYRSLRRLIDMLEPPLLIHCGDLVDDVKIGLRPQNMDLYERGLRELGGVLRSVPGKVMIALGNHDNPELVQKILPFCQWGQKLEWSYQGLSGRLCHYADQIDGDGWNLYGHDGTPNQLTDKVRRLNGQLSINLIRISDGQLFQLDYPRFVDDHRQLRIRAGT